MSAPADAAIRPGMVEFARRAMHLMAARKLAPTPENYRLAWLEVGGPDDAPEPTSPPMPARAVADTELGDELAVLAIQVCENLAGLARAQQWSQALVDTVRSALTRPVRAPAVRAATRMLRHVYAEQSDLADSRKESAEALSKALRQCQGWTGDLDRTAEQFARNLGTYARQVDQCVEVQDARRIMGSVVREAGVMRNEIAASRERFHRACSRAESLREQVAQLEARLADASRQMLVDELTGVFNRRGLERQFERLERECRLRERPLALALVDIDDFKRLNDELGHQVGDRALRHFCVELREGLGHDGVIARYGGEEFVLLMAGNAIDAAAGRVEDLQARMTTTPLVTGSDSRAIRFSAGVTVRAATDTLEAMLARVDEALYRAKRAGKGCVRRA
ncbi:MAG: diguanylate cyclase [Burkholderiaceae bacterium]|nr:diguanylate cyclase [Burkholderiaceae bacterium]